MRRRQDYMEARASEWGVTCPSCHHRVIWHHDTRGCEYFGNGQQACPCAHDTDAVVKNLIDAARREQVTP